MKKIYQDSTFYLIIFIVSYFIYVYPLEILNELLFNEDVNRKTSLFYSLFISVLVIFYFRTKNTFSPLKYFIYEGMGIGFISFWIVNIALIINYFSLFDKYLLGIFSLFLILSISFLGFLFGRLIFIKDINFSTDKITKKSNFIFLTDVHLGSNSIKHLEKILNLIKKLNYDFILIGGDFIDLSSFDIRKLLLLKKITKPIYFVTGNHEYYINNYKEKLNQLSEFGIITLNNESVKINSINLIGIYDNQTKKNQINNYFRLSDKSYFNIALIHKPSIWVDIRDKTELMLSGHTHNGQIFPFNFFVRLQFKHVYGLYSYKLSKLYVSSGAGCWGPRMRVGTSNEIIHFNIIPNQNIN